MLAPISGMTRRDVQIDRPWGRGLGFDHHWLSIYQGRWRLLGADLDLSVDTRGDLARQNDVNAQVCGQADAGKNEADSDGCYFGVHQFHL